MNILKNVIAIVLMAAVLLLSTSNGAAMASEMVNFHGNSIQGRAILVDNTCPPGSPPWCRPHPGECIPIWTC